MSETIKPRPALAYARLQKPAREMAPGAAASLLLHISALLIALFFLMKAGERPLVQSHVIPVDVVIRLGAETTSPPAPVKAPKPVQPKIRSPEVEQSSLRPVEGVAPQKERPLPLDDLDAKLHALARLHQEKSDLPVLDNSGTDNAAATSADAEASDAAAYAIRDFVRATAERHWNLDFTLLGKRGYSIPLHIVMKSTGDVVSVEIVDKNRYLTDAVYRSISLSAKNSVLLSSPIHLPPGDYRDVMEMTLIFNPRDMRH
jgi:hypothetical protein